MAELLDEQFENFDYFYRFKNIKIPDSISSEKTLELFKELKYVNDHNEYIKIRNEIIQGNMKLAKWVLNSLKDYYELTDEWDTYAYEGLIYAIEKFDVDKGFKFSTYASKGIRYFILNRLREIYGVDYALFTDFWRAKKVVEEQFGRRFVKSDTEMLEEILDLLCNMGIITLEGKQRNMSKMSLFGVSLDSEQLEDKIYDYSNVEDILFYDELKAELLNSLDTLTDREKNVLILRFGLDGSGAKTVEETAKLFNITKERIRLFEAKALRKLRDPSSIKLLKPFIEDIDDSTEYSDGVAIANNLDDGDWDLRLESDQIDVEQGVDALEELTKFYEEASKKKY